MFILSKDHWRTLETPGKLQYKCCYWDQRHR